MLCDECQKEPACVHITKVINQQKIEKHLCEQCAQKAGEIMSKGIIFSSKFSIHDFLKEMFDYTLTENARPTLEPVCSDCGLSYSEFCQSGKFGCSGCYQAFAGQLEPLIKRIHGTAAHTGKVPKRGGRRLGVEQQIKRLRHKLEQHVTHEEYELAAQLRDEIKILERQLVADSDASEQ
ncbi:UvrB/uvrC motif protein [Sporomusa ovata DSM 2662]|uniref:Nucleotide excision repair protein, with UvrB/UvrC motif n=1 Tax=Sporomusa ovata TaxID=2378 RepID=A0A0U1KY20_9FIRM|nr:UvrB/UvrC motif-containing protein [Sporomusa ovata]EQB28030.1 UvrB/UvrC protein [Sporomusa ovata DSM 2662]CQR71564.1 Nucleotide excision repair protein, with UvrB/UvrC motif [Sporomusa ovata]